MAWGNMPPYYNQANFNPMAAQPMNQFTDLLTFKLDCKVL